MTILDFRLQVFLSVARRLSFTKAATELFITQPAVSKHIRLLEQQLDTKLFSRQGNSIVLTDSGRLLLAYAAQLEHVSQQIETDIQALSGNIKGSLRIGASSTIAQYILPELFAAFKKKHPDVSLKTMSGNTEEIESALIAGDIDLGFIEGATKNKQIKYQTFSKDNIVLVCRKGLSLKPSKAWQITDLATQSFVLREPGSGTLEVVLQSLEKSGLKRSQLNIELQLDSTEAIKSYLQYSDSLAFISASALDGDRAHAALKIIAVKGLLIERPLYAIQLQGASAKLASVFLKAAISHHQK